MDNSKSLLLMATEFAEAIINNNLLQGKTLVENFNNQIKDKPNLYDDLCQYISINELGYKNPNLTLKYIVKNLEGLKDSQEAITLTFLWTTQDMIQKVNPVQIHNFLKQELSSKYYYQKISNKDMYYKILLRLCYLSENLELLKEIKQQIQFDDIIEKEE